MPGLDEALRQYDLRLRDQPVVYTASPRPTASRAAAPAGCSCSPTPAPPSCSRSPCGCACQRRTLAKALQVQRPLYVRTEDVAQNAADRSFGLAPPLRFQIDPTRPAPAPFVVPSAAAPRPPERSPQAVAGEAAPPGSIWRDVLVGALSLTLTTAAIAAASVIADKWRSNAEAAA